MSISWLKPAIATAVLVAGWMYFTDPLDTPLPFNSTDLSRLQSKLERLDPEDRELVEAYVQRSRGLRLPAGTGGLDAPLTARNFAEAIALQKQWNADQQAKQQKADHLQVERDAKLNPLREVVDVSLLAAEFVTREEYRELVQSGVARPLPHDFHHGSEIFITRIELLNHSAQTVFVVRGSLLAYDSARGVPLPLCWVGLGRDRPLQPDRPVEMVCVERYQEPHQLRAFAASPYSSRFRVEWQPRRIELAGGEVLESRL